MNIQAYCLKWHIKTSDAFRDILVDPLSPFATINLNGWNGDKLMPSPVASEPLIFCMLPPPTEIWSNSKRRIIWIPMWDQAQGYDEAWWRAIPKHVRIVAFSQQVYDRAQRAGLSVLRLQYFINPKSVQTASWKFGRTLFYWNRVGMVGPEFIEQLCSKLEIQELLFKPAVDPYIENNKYYDLPHTICNTKVTVLKPTPTRAEFLKCIAAANIVLAPRLTEGVGMAYLEAMARGCAVIAHNAPTMNEYIQHGRNGILLDKTQLPLIERLKGTLPATDDPPYLMGKRQPWNKLAKMNYEKLGNQARADHQVGYQRWANAAENYASFVLDW